MPSITVTSKKSGTHEIYFDEEDRHIIEAHTWCVVPSGNSFRSATVINQRKIYMHRLLMNESNKKVSIDHINGNPLDNRRSNLRRCTHAENIRNQTGKHGLHGINGFKGVSYNKVAKKFVTRIMVGGNRIHGGCFESKIEAAKRYNELAMIHHGEFSKLNQIQT